MPNPTQIESVDTSAVEEAALLGGCSKSISPSTLLFILLTATGIAIRITLSALSYGTNDVTTWLKFATIIQMDGLTSLYRADPLFNHPPLAGLLVSYILKLANIFGWSFPFALRAVGIFAEVCSIYLLWHLAAQLRFSIPAKTAAIYSFSLISILISGYHGNTDPIYVLFVLLAATSTVVHRSALLAGLFLGLAINVKLIPIIFLPVFFLAAFNLKQSRAFLSAFSLGLVPYILALIYIGSAFKSNVLFYSPTPDYWGLSMFILFGGATESGELAPLASDILQIARTILPILTVAAIIAIAFYMSYKKVPVFEQLGVVTAIFAVLALSFAPQYFVLFPAILVITHPVWCIRIATLSGALALASYLTFLESWYPLQSVHYATASKGVAFIAFLTWLAIVAFLVERIAAIKNLRTR